MCDWVITAPKDLPRENEKKFFEESYKFLEARYGEKNVISAYVHKDETTPHIHFSFVPVGYDKKNDRETVSAKMVLNRADLQTFHKNLDEHMINVFGRNIGVLNDATKTGNTSIEELKRESATQHIINAEIKAQEIMSSSKKIIAQNVSKMQDSINYTQAMCSEMLLKAQIDVQKTLDDKKDIEIEIGALEAKLELINDRLNNIADVKKIEAPKMPFSNKVMLSQENFENLKKFAIEGIKLTHEINEIQEKNNFYTFMYNEMKNNYEPLQKQNINLDMELDNLKRDYKDLEKKLDGVIQRRDKYLSDNGLDDSYDNWKLNIWDKQNNKTRSFHDRT